MSTAQRPSLLLTKQTILPKTGDYIKGKGSQNVFPLLSLLKKENL